MDNFETVYETVHMGVFEKWDGWHNVVRGDKTRSFFIFPHREGEDVEYWAIESTWFLEKGSRAGILNEYRVPRYRCMIGRSIDQVKRYCQAQVNVDDLIASGMDVMDAARLVMQEMLEEENRNV